MAPKKAATKKAAAKKKATPAKSPAKKPAPARTGTGGRPAGGAAPKKSAVKSAAPKAASPKKTREKPAKAKAKMPGETSDTGEFISSTSANSGEEQVTNTDVNNIVTPEAENDEAVFAASTPNQQYMPEDFKASAQDPYHSNQNPSKAKTSVKPSGKKPLWDNRK
ncbi:hypothetical protein [Niabella hibiscisoli]|uniref:hypothetical protein n=1 Tax=Niabella hibiscisoli TaxID=1825928 RepID=UPI001F0CF79A|nr:hypothetical protein [Niabella hibiscisoli]MCH5717019.1 hypothetical protein [Niabella hibiscisoli]